MLYNSQDQVRAAGADLTDIINLFKVVLGPKIN